MKREKIAHILTGCKKDSELLDRVEALLKAERERIVDTAIAQLDRRDAGFNRVVNRLMGLRLEK